ncbi:MAG: SBBP repeat-containing protein, partial [Bacteroidota bacterium]
MKITLPIFTLFLLFFGRVYGQAPPWLWAQEAYSSGSEYGWDVATDTASDMVYVGGTFDGNLSAKYGSSFTSSYGQDDGFLAKYTTTGVFQWAVKIGGTTNDQVKSVAVDPSGNVYVCGYFNGTADFDPSASTFTLTNATQDGFLAKYSSAGTFLWAVKYGGSGNDEPWKMYADANGIYLTGSYATAPATFNSFSSGVTKTTTSTNTNGEVFGVKYNSAGIAQWAISGGGSKIDCGYSVVADANNAYFIGRYDEDITFRNSSGAASVILPHQQSNQQQVFIIAYSQAAGAFVWQTNITCSTGGDNVLGWTIAQDASNLYVSGYLEGDINFKYPSPTLTQTHTGGGSFDIFLAQLSKTGTFSWRAAVTGSGAGEQVGRAVDIDRYGNVILTGYFMSNLNYVAGGGPILSASAKDIFVTSYSNAGTFQWAAKAGTGGDDLVNGLAVDNSGGIYVTGDHDNGAVFGAYTLTDGGSDNMYVSKMGCNALENNTVTANQTICSGNTPSLLTGSLPTGSGPYSYVWEKSPDNVTWTNATGTFTNQNYAPPPLTTTTYYRRKVVVTGVCASTLISSSILITVDAPPTIATAGATQTLCASTATLSANTPLTGSGLWSVITGTASITTVTNFSTAVTGLSNGTNKFVWTISNGVCPSSSSTVTVMRDIPPTISNAGTSQTICASTATLNANIPTTGTGLWSVASGTGSVSNTAFNNSAVTGLSFGANQFVWTISNGTCPSSSSTVTVTRDIPPTTSNAGITQTLCASTATLNANTPTTGTGLWSVASGTGSVSNTTLNNSGVTGLSFGANQFIWTISNGTCPSSSSTVTI